MFKQMAAAFQRDVTLLGIQCELRRCFIRPGFSREVARKCETIRHPVYPEEHF
jgi:hypothetical protein